MFPWSISIYPHVFDWRFPQNAILIFAIQTLKHFTYFG